MIQADNFVIKYRAAASDETEKSRAWWNRVANASVVISRDLFPERPELPERNRNILDEESRRMISGKFPNASGETNSTGEDGKNLTGEVEKSLPVSIRTRSIGAFNLNVVVYCPIKEETIDQWRQQTFMALKAAYRERVQEYNDYMAQKCAEQAQQPEENNDYRINPLMARAIEKRELKRIALELITQTTLLVDIPDLGQNFYWYSGMYDDHNVVRTQDLENYAAHVKFLEEAFDWEIMAYTLYPYYWGKRYDWDKLLKTTSDADFIFQAFLQSGMGKTLVPVRAGFEKAVMYYLDTGDIINTNAILTDGLDGLYQSVIDELDMEEYDADGHPVPPEPEAEWETRIPSSLVIIQKDSNPLDRDGLPCDCNEEKAIGKADEKEGTNLLGVVEASEIG